MNNTNRTISLEEEATLLSSAIDVHPQDLALRSRLAAVKQAIALKLVEDSVRLADQVQKGNPSDYWANFNLALSYLYYWRPMDAWSYCLKAIEIDPTQKYGYELLFNIASRISDPARIMPNATTQLVSILDKAQRTHPSLDLYREENFLERQQLAIGNKIPPILINTLPKSGTIYIRGRLSEALNIPYQQLAIMPLYNNPIPSWVESFSKGGAVAAEHLVANEETIKLLSHFGINKIIVHVRDPRESALSYFYFQKKQSQYSGPIGTVAGDMFRVHQSSDSAFREHCDTYIPWTMNWLHSWLDYAQSSKNSLSVKFTTYEDFLKSEDSFFSELMSFFGINRSIFNQNKPLSDKHKQHFRKGELAEWRKTFCKETQEYVSAMMHDDICKYFGWEKRVSII